MTATKASKKKTKLHPHPVPLPRDNYGGPRPAAEKERRASGYSSLRVSKRTLELLREMEKQALAKANGDREAGTGYYYGRRYYSLGLDELLYWDALQRLAKLPPEID